MKPVLIAFLILAGNIVTAQNLILNPSFEDTTTKVTPLYLPTNWVAANGDGWNYYTPYNEPAYPDWSPPRNVNGFQQAYDGNAYIGINTFSLDDTLAYKRREYLQSMLKRPLVKDSTYCIQFYTSLADSSNYAARGQMGIYFSNDRVTASHPERLPYDPQLLISIDTHITERVEWVKIELQYIAEGGEEWFTMGNFNDSTFLDTLFVPGGGDQWWMNNSYYYYDSFYLGSCDSLPLDTPIGIIEQQLEGQIKLFPNPARERLFVQYSGSEKLQIQLYNLVAKAVDSRVQLNGELFELSVGHLPKGIYLLEIIAGEERITKKIIKQ